MVMAIACHTCGESGFSELLVYCCNCNTPEHQYCFYKLPSYILSGKKELSEDVTHRLCADCESRISNVKTIRRKSSRILNNKRKHNIDTYNKSNLIHKKREQRKASKFSVNDGSNHHQRSCRYSEDPMPSSSEENASDSYSQPNKLENRKRSLRDILRDEKSKKRRRAAATFEGQQYATDQSKCYSPASSTHEVAFSPSSKETSKIKQIQGLSKQLEIKRETAKDEQVRTPRRKLSLSKEESDEKSPVIHNGQRCNIDTSRKADQRSIASSKFQTVSEEKCQDGVRRIMSGQPCFAVDQVYFGTQPIIYYTWRGCLDICGEEYHPVAAHMSSLACEEVWNCAKVLPDTLQLEKLLRSSAWPKSFERPISEESIALYLFPHEQRIEEPFHQLVVNGLGEDFVLLTVLEEVEFLVYSSVLLPERNQRFHGSYYLCGAFRAKRTHSSSTEPSCLNPKQALPELTIGESRMRISECRDRAVEQNSDGNAIVSKNLPYPEKDGFCSSAVSQVAQDLSLTCREGPRSIPSPNPVSCLMLEQDRVEITVENGSVDESECAFQKTVQGAGDSNLALLPIPSPTPDSRPMLEQDIVEITVENGSVDGSGCASQKTVQVVGGSDSALLPIPSPTPGSHPVLEQDRVEITVENGSVYGSGCVSQKMVQVAGDSQLALLNT